MIQGSSISVQTCGSELEKATETVSESWTLQVYHGSQVGMAVASDLTPWSEPAAVWERKIRKMTDMIARCGFKCNACLAFKGNNTTAADQARVAEGWAKYFGLVVLPEKIRCNGCMAKDRGAYDFPDMNCPIAPCVIARGLDNCAGCSEYPCDRLEARMRACDEVKQRFRGAVSPEEYECYIAPYDARTTLNDIRKAKTMRR